MNAIAWAIVFFACVIGEWAVLWEEVQTGKDLEFAAVMFAVLGLFAFVGVILWCERKGALT